MRIRDIPKEWLATTDEDRAKQFLQAKQIIKRIKEDEANNVPIPAIKGFELTLISKDLI